MAPPYYGNNTLGALGAGISGAVKTALPWAQLFSRPDPYQDDLMRLLGHAGLSNMRQAASRTLADKPGKEFSEDKFPYQNILQAGREGAGKYAQGIEQEGMLAEAAGARPAAGGLGIGGEIVNPSEPVGAGDLNAVYNAAPLHVGGEVMPIERDKPTYDKGGNIVESMDFGARTDQPLQYQTRVQRPDATAGAAVLARDIFNEQTAKTPPLVQAHIDEKIAEAERAIDSQYAAYAMHPILSKFVPGFIDKAKQNARNAITQEEMLNYRRGVGADWYYSQHPEMKQENLAERVIGQTLSEAEAGRTNALERERVSQTGSLARTGEERRQFNVKQEEVLAYAKSHPEEYGIKNEAGEIVKYDTAKAKTDLELGKKWEPKGPQQTPEMKQNEARWKEARMDVERRTEDLGKALAHPAGIITADQLANAAVNDEALLDSYNKAEAARTAAGIAEDQRPALRADAGRYKAALALLRKGKAADPAAALKMVDEMASRYSGAR